MKRVEEDVTARVGPIVDELRRRLREEADLYFGALFIGGKEGFGFGFGFVFDDKMPATSRDALFEDMQKALDALKKRYAQ